MKHFIIISILLVLTTGLFSQTLTNKQIENELHLTYTKLLSFRFSDYDIERDSIPGINQVFNQKIKQYISKNPQTLTFQFDSLLKDNFDIVTSEDKLM